MQAVCRALRAALGQASSGACAHHRGAALHAALDSCAASCGPSSLAQAASLATGRSAGVSWRGLSSLAGVWTSAGWLPPAGPLATTPAAASSLAPSLPGLGSLRRDGLGSLATAHAWGLAAAPVRWCTKGQPLSRQRVFKREGINDIIVPNTTQLEHGLYGIRALAGKRVAANTIEAVRRTLRRKIKKTGRLWIRIAATVPVTKKPLGLRMGKGKGAIDHYVTPVRPGQIICEMDRVPRKVALQAMQAAQYKFPVKLGLVEWS